MKKSTFRISAFLSAFAIASLLLLVNACDKEKSPIVSNPANFEPAAISPAIQNQPLVRILSVANIRQMNDGSAKVMFNQNAEALNVKDEAIIYSLRQAFDANKKLKVTFDPWQATIIKIEIPTVAEIGKKYAVINSPGTAMKIDLKTIEADALDNSEKIGVINTTSPGSGLTNIVPDMATAQLMFNYLTKQCCALGGPYGVDYCISFQYAEDGCYARAHKMCYVLNNKYHYDTHKIFSFANAGSDLLSVQAQKWGGCCVNWWYHVAPLVNIKTPTGVKAFVFDPAMFDQPVLLSVWLHAQENPVCSSGYVPNVSMINIQATAAYSPADYTGYAFDPDPMYYDTDATLSYYSTLTTCP